MMQLDLKDFLMGISNLRKLSDSLVEVTFATGTKIIVSSDKETYEQSMKFILNDDLCDGPPVAKMSEKAQNFFDHFDRLLTPKDYSKNA